VKQTFYLNIVNVSIDIFCYNHSTLLIFSVKLELRVRSKDADKPITYEIAKLGLPASKQTFQWKTNGNRLITVENYYKEHYNRVLE